MSFLLTRISSLESTVNTHMPYMLSLFNPTHPVDFINQLHCLWTWLACSYPSPRNAPGNQLQLIRVGTGDKTYSSVILDLQHWDLLTTDKHPPLSFQLVLSFLNYLPFISFKSMNEVTEIWRGQLMAKFSSGSVLFCFWIRCIYRTSNKQSCIDLILG